MKKYVNGKYMEMTDAEIAEIKQMEADAFYAELNNPLTLDRKMEMFVESIPVLPKPTDRNGYIWKPMYDAENHCFGWEEIVDPYYVLAHSGTYTDPISYVDGMPVIADLWYSFEDGNIWECIKSGDNSAYTVEWFDIIEM